MRRLLLGLVLAGALGALAGCLSSPTVYEADLLFLRAHQDVLELASGDGQARVTLVPAYQGRVMTSTATGPGGPSFGWINRKLISSGEILKHINPFGGEDRFWLGPEGGQYAIFFGPGTPYDLESWQTPAVIDSEPYDVVESTGTSARFRKEAKLTNRSGTRFDLRIDREVRLLSRRAAERRLGVELGSSLRLVAYESENRITNTGQKAWTKEGGLLSVWILGMYNPSPRTTVVVPFVPGPESELGPKVNDAYFGKVPPERLVVGDGVLFFSGDGLYRSKIGVGPRRAKPVLGSWDAGAGALTIIQYTKPEGARDYVNSMWEDQKDPYGGDVANSYNDGPAEPGKPPLGPFCELETSSPAAALAPGGSLTHVHRTIHLVGDRAELDAVARAVLGVGLDEIESAL